MHIAIFLTHVNMQFPRLQGKTRRNPEGAKRIAAMHFACFAVHCGDKRMLCEGERGCRGEEWATFGAERVRAREPAVVDLTALKTTSIDAIFVRGDEGNSDANHTGA
ncbi:MAG: hypothetical protein ABI306_09890 [Caulobacteraceae bacterium]